METHPIRPYCYLLAFKSEASRDGEYKIYGGIIVCALRSMSQEHGIEMADLAAKYLKVGLAPMPDFRNRIITISYIFFKQYQIFINLFTER